MSAEKNYAWLSGWYRQAIVGAITDAKYSDLDDVVRRLQWSLDNAEKYMNESALEVSRARIEST